MGSMTEGKATNTEFEKPEANSFTTLECEEKMAEKINELEDNCLQSERVKNEEKDKEKRHKQLMHLLTKSQFYAQFLMEKVQAEEIQENNTSIRQRQEKENKENKGHFSSDVATGSLQTGKRVMEVSAKPRKRQKTGYKLKDVINKEELDQIPDSSQEEEPCHSIEEPPLLFTNGVMRPYQLDGLKWLKGLFQNGISGILADEMGLGKTIQCIAFICYLIERKVQGPFLVVAPLSTLPNWMSEFRRFAPKIPTLLYHGSEEARKEKRNTIHSKMQIKECSVSVSPVVITSYEVAIRDIKFLGKSNWSYIVVDEGHRLKNHNCRLTRCLSSLTASNRLLLTGTPLQNNMAELWSLLNFLLPEIFDSLTVFESWIDISEMMTHEGNEKIIQQEKEQQIVTTLHKILTPFLLRRVKSEVDIKIPKKKEFLVYTPLTSLQLGLYKATLSKDIDSLLEKKEAPIDYDKNGRPKRKSRSVVDYTTQLENYESEESFLNYLQTIVDEQEKVVIKAKPVAGVKFNIKMNNRMMQLRKIVNHPYLLRYPLNENGEYKIDENIINTCGKLQVLEQILAKLQSKGHKVLLFSQMTKLLDILEDYLSLRPQFKYKRLDGSVSLSDRSDDIHSFNNDPTIFLYLLSTRAGGLGINLTSADTVIIYDSDWNPQQDLQAQDRCHRFGQTKPVLVLRLCAESTIDQRILDRAGTKRKLERLILKSGKFKSSNLEDRDYGKIMDREELLELLKETDHERALNTSSGQILSEDELDVLLDRSMWSKEHSDSTAELSGVFKEI